MTRRQFLASSAGATAAFAAQDNRPNIIVIMADDMGFSDLGCYGSEIKTPNLDALAAKGVRFTQFYNTARCCPTRASLMTGVYPHQASVGHMVDNPKAFPGYTGDLNRKTLTIAEALKQAGYSTYMSGKWHVTPVTESKHNWPRQRGFDKYYGIIHGAASFFNPVTLVRDNDRVEPDRPDYYFTDAVADNAAEYVRTAARQPNPFFLYVAFTAPHWPLHAREEDIAKYKGRYKEGWDTLREERRARMIKMGIVEERWAMTERDADVPAWSDAPNKEWQQRRMEVYSAMVDRMDQGVGRILSALRESGREQNTLILFLADNGGCAEELGPKMQGLHVPQNTRDGKPVQRGNLPEIMPGGPDTYQSYGIPWANASNTPFRLYKHWVHEGGISSPLIAHWPAAIRKSSITNEPAHLIDIMATCVDLGGAKYRGFEGVSLRPAFSGKRLERRDALYWEHEGNRAMRQGRWKLVLKHPGQWELYDIAADRTEIHNLADKEPARVAEMAAQYERWAKRAGVLPWAEVQKAPRTPAPIPTV